MNSCRKFQVICVAGGIQYKQRADNWGLKYKVQKPEKDTLDFSVSVRSYLNEGFDTRLQFFSFILLSVFSFIYSSFFCFILKFQNC